MNDEKRVFLEQKKILQDIMKLVDDQLLNKVYTGLTAVIVFTSNKCAQQMMRHVGPWIQNHLSLNTGLIRMQVTEIIYAYLRATYETINPDT